MKKRIVSLLLVCATMATLCSQPVQLKVNAGEQIATVPRLFADDKAWFVYISTLFLYDNHSTEIDL